MFSPPPDPPPPDPPTQKLPTLITIIKHQYKHKAILTIHFLYIYNLNKVIDHSNSDS